VSSFAVAGVVAAALALAACRAAAPKPALDPLRDLHALLALVDEHHVRPLPEARLVAVARDAMLAALDPYSGHLDPSTYAELRAALASRFGGVGMHIDSDPSNTRYWVRAPIAGSPAVAAGIRAGDILTAVDGRPLAGQPMDTVLGWLRGTAGTTVEIEVRQPGATEPRRLRLTRALIEITTVRGLRRTSDDGWDHRVPSAEGIASLRIAHFATRTPDELRRAIAVIATTHPRGLVLDLRHNPGGSLAAAIAVADHFLDRGRIVSLQGRGPTVEHRDATPGTATDLPMAVLVDEATLSAVEIVAASLQDNRRALVVGARSFGKATVQQLFPLGHDGGAVRLTTQHSLRPSGRPLERHWPGSDPTSGGVAPDAGLAVAPAAADAQALAGRIEALDTEAGLVGLTGDAAGGTEIPDKALAAACEALLTGRRPGSD
jgi:carboxyl-terminal processing protease